MIDPASLAERTELLIGAEGLERLGQAHVLVAGLGGVGGACAESLCRAGVGRITLLDHDHFVPSNLNRQLLATQAVIGRNKAEVAVERLESIRDDLDYRALPRFLHASEVVPLLDGHDFDAIADCIDSIGVKAVLLAEATRRNMLTMTALGAGNRIDVRGIRIGLLGEVSGCGLARVLRGRLRKLGIDLALPVVYSTEPARKPGVHEPTPDGSRPRATNGTISYMPNVFGHMVAGEIIRNLLA